MTSLVLTHYRPDRPTSGAPLRNWQNIRALATLGAVDVVTVGVEDASEPIDGVREWAPFSLASRSKWDRLRTALSPLRPGVYPGVDLFYSAHVIAWLRKRSSRRRYDVAVIETIVLAAYLDDLKRAARCVVFDAHNIEAVLQPALDAAASGDSTSSMQRIKQWVLKRRLASAERRVITGADLVWVCSDTDARQIHDRYGRRTGVTVVANGVDLPAYRRPGAPRVDGDWSRLPVTMVYPGLFGYPPNEEAALRLVREVLPAVRARGYAARVVLVGRNPTPTLLAEAKGDAAIEVTGAVDSILPYLEQPCVVALPISSGSGTRLKIAEAFAVGRPVVSTTKGIEGIEAVDGVHVLIRDEPAAMARAVIELWTNPGMRANLCASALDLTRTSYSWSAATDRIAKSLGVPTQSTELPPSARTERTALYSSSVESGGPSLQRN